MTNRNLCELEVVFFYSGRLVTVCLGGRKGWGNLRSQYYHISGNRYRQAFGRYRHKQERAFSAVCAVGFLFICSFSKTDLLDFNMKTRSDNIPISIHLGEESVESSTEVRFFGLIIDSDLKFEYHSHINPVFKDQDIFVHRRLSVFASG